MTPKFMARQQKTGKCEGGWANSPNDRGGETVFGVARNFWPYWLGWHIVDAIAKTKPKGSKAFKDEVNNNETLKEMAHELFFTEFWNAIRAEELPEPVDGLMYDLAINSGPATAIKLLTKVIAKMGCPEARSKTFSDVQITFIQDIHDTDMFPQLLELWFLKRKQKYQYIADNVKGQSSNLIPWMNRLRYLAQEYIGYLPAFLNKDQDDVTSY